MHRQVESRHCQPFSPHPLPLTHIPPPLLPLCPLFVCPSCPSRPPSRGNVRSKSDGESCMNLFVFLSFFPNKRIARTSVFSAISELHSSPRKLIIINIIFYRSYLFESFLHETICRDISFVFISGVPLTSSLRGRSSFPKTKLCLSRRRREKGSGE